MLYDFYLLILLYYTILLKYFSSKISVESIIIIHNILWYRVGKCIEQNDDKNNKKVTKKPERKSSIFFILTWHNEHSNQYCYNNIRPRGKSLIDNIYCLYTILHKLFPLL